MKKVATPSIDGAWNFAALEPLKLHNAAGKPPEVHVDCRAYGD
jgi:hypothetical protein